MTGRPRKFKVVLMGASSVGKTSLVIRFSRNVFSENQDATIGAAFISREMDTAKGPVALHVWDTAGQERYRALVPRYSQGASAILVVFDLSEAGSLDSARDWFAEAHENHPIGVSWFLVGNKCDLAVAADVEKAKAFAAAHGLAYVETSAKTGQNVDELFARVAVAMAQLPPADPIDLEGLDAQPPKKNCCSG
jgi:small GTP-binding protein